MKSLLSVVCLWLLVVACTGVRAAGPADVPTDNPVATYYADDRGYPAWTDRIQWSRVLNMKTYAKGKTNFEKFENARDELAAQGGGLLYYPAGTYDFSEGPFDGPDGRGLMLRSGVVIRGEAPKGQPKATGGRLELPTKFVFGAKRRTNAIDAGQRMTLELDGADIRVQRRPPGKNKTGEPTPEQVIIEPAPLILSFAVKDGKLEEDVKAFRRGYGRDVWIGKARIDQSPDAMKLAVELTIADEKQPGKASYQVVLAQRDGQFSGEYSGMCRDREAKGKAHGRMLTITPGTPRDWNFIGQIPEKGKRLKDINDVGVVWVHLVGGTIWFGPDVQWGDTWATADSWKSEFAVGPWAARKPDGTHPWDPFAGGKKDFVGVGDGRLVFGCVLEQAAVLNESITMGRPDFRAGFGPGGYYTHKFAARIAAYGSRVLIANNRLPISRGRNFKYEQTTRYTFPAGKGAAGFGETRKSIILFDYNKILGIDVNMTMLGYTKASATGEAHQGYFMPGVVVIDNYVYNNGHKGFNVSGDWVTIARNHNEREMLREGYDPERIGGWKLTLDGHLETAAGGPGTISDNLARAFDLGGKNLWVHKNTYNNTGSAPGNDGEGILCQAHGGTEVYSWAITYNEHQQGHGATSYIGGWDVNMAGALFGWNKTAGWIGSVNVARRESADIAFVGNQAGQGEKPMAGAQVGDPGGKLNPPGNVKAEIHRRDALQITWVDGSNNEVGFRVDRRIGAGPWTPIAYRPPHIAGHPQNPQAWIDFLAPPGRPLVYRVVSLGGKDNDEGASAPTAAVTLESPRRPLWKSFLGRS